MFTSIAEGFKQFIPNATLILGLVFILSIAFLAFLYYRCMHMRKRITPLTETMKAKEILGSRGLEQQMLILSYTHKNVKWHKCNFFIGHRNQIFYKSLNKIRNTLSEVPSAIIVLIPAARWLFDNFHMLYWELKKVNMTGTNRKPLPILQEGEFKGYPRIYVVARKMVTLSGGYLNEDNIFLMIKAYQKELPLTAIELWVLTEMIGLCLLEDIIALAEDIIHIAETKSRANAFVNKRVREQEGTGNISIFLKEVDENSETKTYFHSHVIYLLKNMSFDEASIQRYVEHYYKFNDNYSKPSDIFLDEGKIESFLESSIRVLLTSLRETREIDTENLLENLSILEYILLKDPDGVYPEMDSDSRSRYRSVIEKLALKHNINEILIAENCLELAEAGRENLKCSHHVGAYLVGQGYPILKAKVLNKSVPKSLKPKSNLQCSLYFLSISVMVFIAYFFLGQVLQETSLASGIYAGLTFLVVSLCLIMGIAIDLTNNIFTRLVPVRQLLSMDFLKEIPDTARTFVVMPVIISSKEQGLEYINRLHRHYLANRQSNLFFALLVDFEDSAMRCMPKDDMLKNVFSDRINQLNALYPFTYRRFSLFIRSRQWNESENCYMGWERKRGKIEEFNALLSGEKDTSFSMILCDEGLLSTFKYVITLDADSSLIKNNAAKLVGIMEHPLNQPVLDPTGRKITEGYGIIQPSVANHISSKKSSLFYRVFAGKQGLDRYSTVISDIYHDVFDEGVYVGKGIYHIKAFHNILYKTLQENSILSHDLLESCYVSTAFSSTVKIMDDHPNCVLSYAKREHRWIRGDWQLLPWLFKSKALTGLSRWKILDNFRRSLVSLCRVFLILLNLALIPEMFYLWLPLIFFTDVVNLSLLLYNTIINKIKRPTLALVYKGLLKDIRLLIQRALLDIVFAPYMAYIATDAILRTLYRLFKSKKNLLMWNTSETIDKCRINTKMGYFLHMWASLIPSIFIIGLLMVVDIQPIGMIIYGALSVAWGLSFLIAYEISQPRYKSENEELKDNKKMLRGIARGTWQFFVDFSTSDNNWLCPDNYQKEPVEKVTDKTSPTNIGLQLLAVLSARDLGYETLNSTLKNVENILYSVAVLTKWKGHLFNWYNIKNLQVLNPQYISTVDSGNFFGHLITLKNGLLELIDDPLFSPKLVFGLRDTIILCKKEIILKEEYKTIGDFIEEITAVRDTMHAQEKKPRAETLFVGELDRSINLIIKEAAALKIDDSSFSLGPTLKQLALKNNLYAKDLMERIEGIANTIDIMFENVDFRALYNEKRMQFHIGYNLSSQRLDTGCYDLMASESSLTSFLAIAKDDVPVKHWYKLGRPLTLIKGIPCFVSWSGTMFEYLMPNLVMREYEGSVFAETSRVAVLKHIEYAKELGIPWGISESQHYHFDLDSNYQYKAFGVPVLRLQASLNRSTLVVAPYATILALGYAEEDCFSNLKKMAELGCVGDYGYYEAIDFTGPDPVAITPHSIVKSFMAHHQGMNLVAINNFLHNRIMQRRFHSEPIIQAIEALLEEKQHSHFVSISKKGYNIQFKKMEIPEEIHISRYVNRIAPEIPVAHFLSINNYSMMITSDGDGFSDYRDMMLYRWRSDLYASTGNHIFIKDVEGNRLWSSAYNPTKTEPDKYQVVFWPHQAEFKRRDGEISTDTIVSLSPNHNLEIRKVTLTNHSKEKKQIELTSYMEVVVDRFSAEISHPAFNKLFIESWFIDDHHIFLSKRRSSKDSHKPYLMHMVKSSIKPSRSIEYENDRLKFMGRNNTVQNPDAVVHSLPLSNSADFSKDPIISMRVSIDLEAASIASVYFITGVCANKEEAVRIGEELSDVVRIEHLNQMNRQQSDLELKYINITTAQLNAFQDLISPIFYPSRYYRGPAEIIRRNWKNQSYLWRFGVSGDNPILLLRVTSTEQAGIIREVIKAYEYLRINKVKVNLIVLNEAKYGYMQDLNDLLNDMTTCLKVFDESREKPSMFILHSYQMTPAEVDLLLSVARVVFTEKTGIYFRNVKEFF